MAPPPRPSPAAGHALWSDRAEAGRLLAERFADLRGRGRDTLLIALPRGGVAVAAQMARALELPLATWAVRKVAHPSYPEYAIGAVAPGGVVLWDEADGGYAALGGDERLELVRTQEAELERRRAVFGDPAAETLRGLHLVVVDDGIATGLTARAALLSLRRAEPASLALAVPVVDRRVVPALRELVDRLETLAVVERLRAVGEWYENFEQVGDGEVITLLRRARGHGPR